jgi:tetratricopeptide (TPR) repeat protein
MLGAIALLVTFAAVLHRSSADRSNLAAARCEIDIPQEVASLEECLALAPDNVEIMLDLGGAFEAAGEWARAEELYRRASEADPRDAEVHLRLARLLGRRGQDALARQAGERALAIRPNSAEALAMVSP